MAIEMRLIGPFSQVVTFQDAEIKGPLKLSDMGILQQAGIIFNNREIVKVGDFQLMGKSFEGEIIELAEKSVALPGLVDCHTHMLWAGSRAGDFEKRNSGVSYQQILEEGGGIMDTVKKTRSASDQELLNMLLSRLNRHLLNGVTTSEVKTGYGLDVEEELRMLKVIQSASDLSDSKVISTFLGAHVCPSGFEKRQYLEYLMEEAIPKIKRLKLSNRCDIFVEPEAFPADLAADYLSRATAQGFDITVHGGQFTPDGVKVAIENNAVSVDHLENIGRSEIEALAKSETIGVALPGASLGLGEPFTPVRKLLDANASIAIATDWNPGSAPQGDLLTQASILATYEKLNIAEVFAGITFRAANALRLMDRGRLTSGYLADFVIFEVDDIREVIYQMGSLRPKFVYKNGELKT